MTERAENPDFCRIRDRAVAAAMGTAAFDLLISGGKVADVITGEIRAADVGISGPLIASVHPPGKRRDAASVIDAAGKIVAPGLIDMHMHIESSMVTPATYANAVLARGVTTLIWDPHELANVSGIKGIEWAVKAAAAAPNRIITLAPSCVPSAPGLERSGADFDAEIIRELLAWDRIGGVAELMDMQGVIGRGERMAGIVQAGLASGKLVCGHARGLTGSALNAYAAAGVQSDHEITSGSDLIEKIHAGLSIELRGSHDHLLPEFVDALARFDSLPPTVSLCTDDVFPDDLHVSGGLDDVVRRLVSYGLPPMQALTAATHNAALRLGRQDLGAVAPGRRADIVIFGDIDSFVSDTVIADGRITATAGRPVADPASPDAASLQGAVRVEIMTQDCFRIQAAGQRVRVATIDFPRFTRWGETVAEVEAGRVLPPPGCALMAVVNRHGVGSPAQVALLRHWGNWRGALCTSVSHDSHNLTVFGGNETDMAVAANSVISGGGGLAVTAGGRVLARLPLPLAGLMSAESLAGVAGNFRNLREAADRIVEWSPPYLVFKSCFGASLACNPGPHLTDMGIVDAADGRILKSPVLGPE